MRIDIKIIDSKGKVIGTTNSDDNFNSDRCIAKHDGVLDHVLYTLLNKTCKGTIVDKDRKKVERGEPLIVAAYNNIGFIELH